MIQERTTPEEKEKHAKRLAAAAATVEIVAEELHAEGSIHTSRHAREIAYLLRCRSSNF